MTTAWQPVPLGSLLKKSEEVIWPAADARYTEVTVRLWGRGVVARGEVDGLQLVGQRRFRARPGQFIASRIDARNGALGVVPTSLDGAIVTNDFPLFDVDPERLEPAFLNWLSRTERFVELCRRASEGTTNRVRLKEERFLALEVALPSVEAQRRIFARIEAIAGKVEEAKRLRGEAEEEAEVLIYRAVTKMIDAPNWDCRLLGDVLSEPPRNGLAPQAEVESDGRPMLRINAVSSAPTRYVDTAAAKQVSVSDAVAAPFVLRHDDVFIVRYNGDINRVAKAAIYKGDNPEGTVFPDKLMRLRPDRSVMSPDFLAVALSARRVRAQIEEIGKTTAGNIGISGADAKAFVVSVPPLMEQSRIVRDLEMLRHEIATIVGLQTEATGALDALLPAVLDKAFRGEM